MNSFKLVIKNNRHSLRISTSNLHGNSHAIRAFATAPKDTKENCGVDPSRIKRIPQEKIRNFCVIAHVDHGKSTLSDRMLELTGNMKAGGDQDQVLDSLRVERERGITVKANTATMLYTTKVGDAQEKDTFLLNLVDTPGHVDFSFEVVRSLGACQGAVLLVDSSQGIQAQTIANHRFAKERGLLIIPCLTKLDLPHSDPERTLLQIEQTLGYTEDEVVWTSAKTGEGVEDLMNEIVKRVPPPTGVEDTIHMRSLIADSWYNRYKGVICMLSVVDGSIKAGQKVMVASSRKAFEVIEVGALTPAPLKLAELRAGQVGYMVAGMKEIADAPVGDTLFDGAGEPVLLQSFERPKSMLFASVYPLDASGFEDMRKTIGMLLLNDASVDCQVDSNTALGQGFRCGFLGKLHMEVFFQRLHDEYETDIISTAPSVPFTAILKDGTTVIANSARDLPNRNIVKHYLEPMSMVTVVAPEEYTGAIMTALAYHRGVQVLVDHVDNTAVVFKYEMPWQEVIVELHDKIKLVSSGHASFDYVAIDSRKADIVCVDLLLNGDIVDALSFVCPQKVAADRGRAVVKKLAEVIKRQQFQVAIQAAIGGKIVARGTVQAFKKDVLMKSGKVVGGGDQTRKKKLLEKQKKGKKKMKMFGKVQLTQEAFMAVLES